MNKDAKSQRIDMKTGKAQVVYDVDGYFKKAVEMCVDLKIERQQVYGDTWKRCKNYEFLGLIRQKFSRLEHLILEEIASDIRGLDSLDNNYEKVEDTLIDIVNWSLFMLAKRVEDNEIAQRSTK
jgi:hypothetical protein